MAQGGRSKRPISHNSREQTGRFREFPLGPLTRSHGYGLLCERGERLVLGFSPVSDLSKLALFLFHSIGHDDVWGADLSRKNGMCDLNSSLRPGGPAS